jgi:hypothetical protein
VDRDSTFCEAAFETPCAAAAAAAQRDQTPYRASLRKPALARIVGYLYTAVDLCQMDRELDGN